VVVLFAASCSSQLIGRPPDAQSESPPVNVYTSVYVLSVLSTNEPETSTPFTVHVPTERPVSPVVMVVVTTAP